eukprot:5651286-Prymnesium_polylepis.1
MPKATRLRKSRTDGMQSDAENLMSGCERQLITRTPTQTNCTSFGPSTPPHASSWSPVRRATSTTFAISRRAWRRWSLYGVPVPASPQ